MAVLTVYGGSGVRMEYYVRGKRRERYSGIIGGNQVLVEGGNGVYWIDLGLPFNRVRNLEMWSWDKLPVNNLETDRIVPVSKILEIAREYGRVDVLVSHAHLDHYGCMVHFRRLWRGGNNYGIPVIYSVHVPENLENIMRARIMLGKKGNIIEGIDAYMMFSRLPKNVEAIEVDHSMDYSYSYIIYEDNATILYTGDYRFTNTFTIEDYIEKIREHTDRIDILITEFTRVSSTNMLREDELPQKFNTIMSGMMALPIIILGNYANTRRFRTFLESGVLDKYNTVYVSDRLAYMLELVGLLPRIADKVRIIKTRKREGIYGGLFSRYDVVEMENIIDEVSVGVGSDIVFLDKYSQGDFKTMFGYLSGINMVAILSYSEAYDEEGFLELKRTEEYLLNSNIPVYQLHATGHANINEIIRMVRKMKESFGLKNVVVVHTTHPELAQRFLFNIVRTIIPVYGKKYSIDESGVLHECK